MLSRELASAALAVSELPLQTVRLTMLALKDTYLDQDLGFKHYEVPVVDRCVPSPKCLTHSLLLLGKMTLTDSSVPVFCAGRASCLAEGCRPPAPPLQPAALETAHLGEGPLLEESQPGGDGTTGTRPILSVSVKLEEQREGQAPSLGTAGQALAAIHRKRWGIAIST